MTPEPAARPSAPAGIFARVSDLGASAQASIPGLYAWAVTVAPAAFVGAHPPPLAAAKVAAVAGPASLALALLVERRWPRLARPLSVWGLTLSSALVWLLVPGALAPLRLESTRGLAGMVGWALFAFASAAPAIPRDDALSARIVEGSLRPRTRLPRGDAAFMIVGALVACILQAIGWRPMPPERAVLVRLVTLAAGLAVVGGATTVALARHTRRIPAPRRERLRAGLPWLVLLSLLLLSGFGIRILVGP